MRIAIVSDVHGNRTAVEAVLADLRQTSPDLILHGGDLAHGGASPAEIVDRIRDLGWQGVLGTPMKSFCARIARGVREPIVCASCSLGCCARRSLGPVKFWEKRELHGCAAGHAFRFTPRWPWCTPVPSTWRSPGIDASDDELKSVYAPLGQPIAVYGHIHCSYIRRVSGMIVANTGSVSLSYDGDRRAAYLLLDDARPSIRRVEYDVDAEIKALSTCGLPHADWMARTLASARPQMP